eukprot:m.1189324 g.1189324  ORF g.1189324 m.1189324 type:complete len:385 (-) comp24554_c3_seq29:4604-5758(-)
MLRQYFLFAVALVSLSITSLWLRTDSFGDTAEFLWWNTFPSIAMELFRMQKRREQQPNFVLSETSYKVYYDDEQNLCAVDTSQIFSIKLFHSIYDDVLRGVSSCCSHTHGKSPDALVLVNVSHGVESDKVEMIAQLSQSHKNIFGTNTTNATEVTRAVESHLGSMTELHKFDNISFPSLQWHQAQPKVNDQYDSNLICGLDFLHRLFSRQLVVQSPSTPGENAVKNILIWGRGNGARSLAGQVQLEKDLEAAFHKKENLKVVNVAYPDLLSIHEQLELLQQASVIISPHGAGLSLILALPKNALVIELYAVEYMEHWLFKNIASMLELQHAWVPCSAVKNDTRFDEPVARYRNSPIQCSSVIIVQTITSYLRSIAANGFMENSA